MIRRQRRGPALFELLQGDRTQRSEALLPPGLRVVRDEPEDLDDVRDEADSVAGHMQPAAVVAQSPVTHREGEPKQGLIELDGNRLRLNLTPVAAAATVFVVCLAVLGAFVLGQQRGDRSGFLRGYAGSLEATSAGSLDGLEAARNQPPATHLVESLLEESPDRRAQDSRSGDHSVLGVLPTTAPAAKIADSAGGMASDWVRDHTYIVAQEFSAGREEDARRAQRFLVERGIDCEVIRFESGAMQLVTTRGFDHRDAAQKKLADEFLKKERAAGADYFASGGGYKMEGYYKTLKGEQW